MFLRPFLLSLYFLLLRSKPTNPPLATYGACLALTLYMLQHHDPFAALSMVGTTAVVSLRGALLETLLNLFAIWALFVTFVPKLPRKQEIMALSLSIGCLSQVSAFGGPLQALWTTLGVVSFLDCSMGQCLVRTQCCDGTIRLHRVFCDSSCQS